MLWKIAVAALIIIFLVADSIYLYFRLKKYWQGSSWNKPGTDKKKWKLGLSSLDLPTGKSADTGKKLPRES